MFVIRKMRDPKQLEAGEVMDVEKNLARLSKQLKREQMLEKIN